MSLKKLGRYEIIRPLGQGAMGLVYEAHDPNISRNVAIKTIRVDQLTRDMAAEFESRFRCETQAGGRLQHPNIIGVYDAGNDQGLAFMVMELVRGGDLRQQLDAGRSLNFARAMGLMRELLSALNFAHEHGVIHCDIKPANVMLDLKGRVKLGDFGVAQIADVGIDGKVIWPQSAHIGGATVGTLKYLSPEQVDGLPIDARADLFAAGVLLYQLLTGTKPFEGNSDFAVMQAITQRDPIRPSSLNPGLPCGIDAVVFKALAKNRDDRYASARDFALALRAVTQPAAGKVSTAGPFVSVPVPLPITPGFDSSSASGSGAIKPSVAQAMEMPVAKVDTNNSDDDATRLARPVSPRAGPVCTLARAAIVAAGAAEFEPEGVAAQTTAPAAVATTRRVAHSAQAGHGRVIAVAASLTLLGASVWFVARDTEKPPGAPLPTSRPAITAIAPPTVAALPPAAVPAPIVAPAPPIPAAPEAAAPLPVDTGATLTRATALERQNLNAALDVYAKVATGADSKAAAVAARRLWTLYRDGAKGLAVNPQQAQRWYDRAKQLGAKLPIWTAEAPVQPRAASAATATVAPMALTSPRTSPVTATASSPELNSSVATPSPAPAAASNAEIAPLLVAPVAVAPAAAKPSLADLFERGQTLEVTSLRQAENAYRDAARQGHGASQKRLWELLLKAGRTSEAVRFQKDAWDQKVPGVPEPKSAIRL